MAEKSVPKVRQGRPLLDAFADRCERPHLGSRIHDGRTNSRPAGPSAAARPAEAAPAAPVARWRGVGRVRVRPVAAIATKTATACRAGISTARCAMALYRCCTSSHVGDGTENHRCFLVLAQSDSVPSAVARISAAADPLRGSFQAREEHLAQLPDGRRALAEVLTRELDSLEALKADAEDQLAEAAESHPAVARLTTAPGFGRIRAAQVVAIGITPKRFRTLRQFWSYCGLAVAVLAPARTWDLAARCRNLPRGTGLVKPKASPRSCRFAWLRVWRVRCRIRCGRSCRR
jgi:hypothetical protein